MGIFQHGGRAIPYSIESAPFAQDLLLLQSSKFNLGFWRPVLDSFEDGARAGGRVVTCEWFEPGLSEEKMASQIKFFVDSLGLGPLDVVACGEAVPVLKVLEQNENGVIRRKLTFAHALPKVEEMTRLIREFCGL